MSFDWKTEESDWDHKPSQGAASSPRPKVDTQLEQPAVEVGEFAAPRLFRRRAIPFLVVCAVLIIALAALVYRQVDRRIAEGQKRAETEVLASHEIVRNAAGEGDTELFVSFLSGRDPEWAAAQANLVNREAFGSRSHFGFYQTASGAPVISPTITLGADLNSAELSSPQAYDVSIGIGLTETITLTQSAVYRRSPDRWLLAPPDFDYWGNTETVDGRYARIEYPARDAAIVHRLARDWEAALADFCPALAGGCPALTVRLSTDPASLAGRTSERSGGSLSEIALPSPSLFGLPVDEAGYRALSRQYSSRLLASVTDEYTGWTCCVNGLFYHALNNAALDRLGLYSWGVSAGQYQLFLKNSDPLAAIANFWQSYREPASPSEMDAMAPFIDFLTRDTGALPAVELQRLLVEHTDKSFWEWLTAATRHRYPTPAAFERAWLQYAAGQQPAAESPIALPDQDLQLICRSPGALRSALYRYDLQGGSVTREGELSILDAPMLVAMPDRERIMVFGRNSTYSDSAPYIWQNGQIIPVSFEDEMVAGFVPLPPEDGADTMTFFLDSGSAAWPFALLTPDSCAGDETCPAVTVIGSPLPSPDRRHSLYIVGASNPLAPSEYMALIYLGDQRRNTLSLVGYGWSPFWLDNESYGYVTAGEGLAGQAVVIRRALPNDEAIHSGQVASSDTSPLFGAQQPNLMGGTTGDPINELPLVSPSETLLTTTALADWGLVPAGTGVRIDRVIPDSLGENLFIFTANPFLPGVSGRAIVYNIHDNKATAWFDLPAEPVEYRRAYRFSPDGRRLAVVSLLDPMTGNNEMKWSVNVQSVGDSNSVEYPLLADDHWTADWLVDWSSDSRWLAITTGGYVRLVAPDAGYSFPLIIADLACTAAVWVNER